MKTLLTFLFSFLDDSTDSGNFFVRGYLPLIPKDAITHMNGLGKTSFCTGLFLTWNSLTATPRHGVTRKRSTKKLQHTENLFRKNQQLKDVC